MFKTITLAAAALSLSAGAAFAHITLEASEAHIGGSFKAVLRVPHGCAGKPTIAVRMQVPEGFIAVKPMPKPGWQLSKTQGSYAKTYDYYGTPTTQGVTQVTWSGGSLPDDEYDEFVLRGYLSADLPVGGSLYFPVVQDCPDGMAERWIEIPAAGQSSDDLELPAPGIRLLPATGGH